MPLFALGAGILLVFGLHRVLREPEKERPQNRTLMGSGLILMLVLSTRIFGGNVLYVFLPMVQRWMKGESATGAKQQTGSDVQNGPMTREQAALILGVSVDADVKEIKQSYKQLMMKLHPDKGGSDFLAAQLNDAKDTLLK